MRIAGPTPLKCPAICHSANHHIDILRLDFDYSRTPAGTLAGDQRRTGASECVEHNLAFLPSIENRFVLPLVVRMAERKVILLPDEKRRPVPGGVSERRNPVGRHLAAWQRNVLKVFHSYLLVGEPW